MCISCALTFELRRDQRQDARARLAKMYRVPPGGPWWPAVGPRLERGVRHHSAATLESPACSRFAFVVASLNLRTPVSRMAIALASAA